MNQLYLIASVFSTSVPGAQWAPVCANWGHKNKCCKSNINLLRIPTGGRLLTSWIFISVEEELKHGITASQIQLMVRAGIEPAGDFGFERASCLLGHGAPAIMIS